MIQWNLVFPQTGGALSSDQDGSSKSIVFPQTGGALSHSNPEVFPQTGGILIFFVGKKQFLERKHVTKNFKAKLK